MKNAIKYSVSIVLIIIVNTVAQKLSFKSGTTISSLFPSTCNDSSITLKSVSSPFVDINYTFYNSSLLSLKIGLEYIRTGADFIRNKRYPQVSKGMNINCNYLIAPIDILVKGNKSKKYLPNVFLGLAPSVNIYSIAFSTYHNSYDTVFAFDPLNFGNKFSIDLRAGIHYGIFNNIRLGTNYALSLNGVSDKVHYFKKYKSQYFQLFLEQDIIDKSPDTYALTELERNRNKVSLIAFGGYSGNVKKSGMDSWFGGPRYTLGLSFLHKEIVSFSFLYSYNCMFLYAKQLEYSMDNIDKGKVYGGKELSTLGIEIMGIDTRNDMFKLLYIGGISWSWNIVQYISYNEETTERHMYGSSLNSFWNNKDLISSFGVGFQINKVIIKPLINFGFNNPSYFSIETGWSFSIHKTNK